MEEIKIKPSLKLEILGLKIGLILIISVIFSIFGIIIILGVIMSYIYKVSRSYIITENEVRSHYDLLVKNSKTNRIDQITNIALKQGFFEKKLNLGTISFDIFGSNSKIRNNNFAEEYTERSLVTFENYNEVFEKLAKLIGINFDEALYTEKPSTKPIKSIIIIFSIINIILFFSTILKIFNSGFIEAFFLIMFFLLSLLILIVSIFAYLKIRSTKYILTNNYIQKEYNYILGSGKRIIPYKKITNHDTKKNIILYSIFKIGDLKIYTGGSNDPIFSFLENFETFDENLKKLLANSKDKIQNNKNFNLIGNQKETENKSALNENKEKIIKKINNIDVNNKILFNIKPGISFLLTIQNIYLLIISILLMSLTNLFIILFIIYLIYKLIYWKNIRYEFLEDRIISYSGIFNITKKEIYYKNIKYLKLERKLFFEKLFGQGTINVLNPGTSNVDIRIYSIKEYKQIYEELEKVIIR